MNQEKIGLFIKVCRKEKAFTQEQLGEKLGVTPKAISKWENGKSLPDPSLYKPLCELLGISLIELFEGERIKEEEVKEKADDIVYEFANKQKENGILQTISSIMMPLGFLIIFFPAIKPQSQLSNILFISFGLLSILLGLFLKVRVWANMSQKTIKYSGMGFTSALTLLFIALKLTNYIDWPWLWVFSPFIISFSLVFLFLVILFVYCIIKDKC